MLTMPLVSVVVTSYNQVDLLERAINSVLYQSYGNIEIVIVDDGSTDGSVEYIKELAISYPGRIVYKAQVDNVGIPKNKNSGFKLSKGDFITYLDGDDTYYHDKVATEVEKFLSNRFLGVVYSNFDFKEYDGNTVKIWAENGNLPEGSIFNDIVTQNFPHGHLHRYEMFKRQVMYDLDFYDESFSIYHDLDFMLRYSLIYNVGYNHYCGSSYFKNPTSIVSTTKAAKRIEQMTSVYQKHKDSIVRLLSAKKYREIMDRQELDKLFFSEPSEIGLYISALVHQPRKTWSILKAWNFANKKNYHLM